MQSASFLVHQVAVEPAEHVNPAVDPRYLIDRFGDDRMQQGLRGQVEHVADVIVAGDLAMPNRLVQLERPWPASNWRWWARKDRLCMKHAENAAMPMSPMGQVALLPQRLSGNRYKEPRNDPSWESSGARPAANRNSGVSQIPDLRPEGRFRSTVACRTHHLGRDRNSFEFGTAECGQWILREQ